VLISIAFCGSAKRSSARSLRAFRTMMGCLFARTHAVCPSCAAWLVPGLWPMEMISSHWSKSSRETVPLRYRWISAGRHWWPRGTCSSSRGSCSCRIHGRKPGTGTPPRWSGSPRSIELGHVWIRQRAQCERPDLVESGLPGDCLVGIKWSRRKRTGCVSRPSLSSSQVRPLPTVISLYGCGRSPVSHGRLVASHVTALAPFSQKLE